MGNTFLESVALKIDLIHLLVLIVPQMCCVHFYYVTIYLCSGLFGCDVQKGKTRQKNYSGQETFAIFSHTVESSATYLSITFIDSRASCA